MEPNCILPRQMPLQRYAVYLLISCSFPLLPLVMKLHIAAITLNCHRDGLESCFSFQHPYIFFSLHAWAWIQLSGGLDLARRFDTPVIKEISINIFALWVPGKVHDFNVSC